jgi:hypothetical protein
MRGHRTDWISLVFGLVFTGTGVLLLTGGSDFVTQLRWAVPVVLILVSLCLIGSAMTDRPRAVPGVPVAAPRDPWGGAPAGPGGGEPSGGDEASTAPETGPDGAPG